MKKAKTEQLYTYKEGMAFLRISPSTMQRLIHAGKLIGRKVGRNWRFTMKELDQVIQPVSVEPVKTETEQGEQAK